MSPCAMGVRAPVNSQPSRPPRETRPKGGCHRRRAALADWATLLTCARAAREPCAVEEGPVGRMVLDGGVAAAIAVEREVARGDVLAVDAELLAAHLVTQ